MPYSRDADEIRALGTARHMQKTDGYYHHDDTVWDYIRYLIWL